MSAKVRLWILILEAAGFVGVIAVIWLDELVDLPYYLFGTPRTPGRSDTTASRSKPLEV